MKILIDIGHPAHVHLFKNFIWEMTQRGNEIKVTARNKDVTLQLLDSYKIPYEQVGKISPGRTNLIKEWILRDISIYKIAMKFKPDYFMGVLNPVMAHCSKLSGKTSIIFTDSEPEAVKYPIADLITLPFANIILTLSSVRHEYGSKAIKICSYKELAYLHPNRFKPNIDVIKNIGIAPNEYVILRFIGWHAYHDVGNNGFNLESKIRLVKELEQYTKVFITSESPLPSELEKYKLPISPANIHDILYYAKLLVSDSQTMTTEAGVLGTPAVRCNSFVGKHDMGNFIELEEKYGLIYNYNEPNDAINKAINLIERRNLKDEWSIKKQKLLNDKADLTSFMVEFIGDFHRGIISTNYLRTNSMSNVHINSQKLKNR